jgi:adenylyltransferase/sulfurtransferase
VADALRILTGADVHARITTLDLWKGGIRQIDAPERDPECPTCARREFPYLVEAPRPPESLCGRNAVQISGETRSVDLAALQRRLEPLGQVRANDYALRFVAAPYELTVFPDGRAIVKGTSDTGIARSLYARYVG